jgi:hypothetical protein
MPGGIKMQDLAASVLFVLWVATSLHMVWKGAALAAFTFMTGLWLVTRYCFKDARLRLAGAIFTVGVIAYAVMGMEDTLFVVFGMLALLMLLYSEVREFVRKRGKAG